MMARSFSGKKSALRRLSESEFGMYSDDEDIRGWSVLDPTGDDIGHVSDMLIDERNLRVRFIEVTPGRFYGIRKLVFLIPFDAITNITNDSVTINQPRERLTQAPAHDPLLIDEKMLNKTYKFYGLMPFWSPEYTSPIHVRCYV